MECGGFRNSGSLLGECVRLPAFAALCLARQAGAPLRVTLLSPWLLENFDKIQLDFLPPYIPELNPIERVWKLTRRLCTHNRYFEALEELIESVHEQFNDWPKPNDQMRRLCAIN
jgi:hypothetical protein